MKQLFILITLFIFPFLAFADGESCFPIGAARHDIECYNFEKTECQKTDDIYSCGWGVRSENAPSDDEQLICDNSRCPNALDDEEDFAEPE